MAADPVGKSAKRAFKRTTANHRFYRRVGAFWKLMRLALFP
jgi:hypothetical protein